MLFFSKKMYCQAQLLSSVATDNCVFLNYVQYLTPGLLLRPRRLHVTFRFFVEKKKCFLAKWQKLGNGIGFSKLIKMNSAVV